jgi:DNA-binding response OmpR family regulator
LLDIKLPDMDGLKVCELIKERFPGTLVLAMSAVYTEVTERLRGLQREADVYLVEPVEPQELLATVRALLRPPRGLWQHAHRAQPARRRCRTAFQAGAVGVHDRPAARLTRIGGKGRQGTLGEADAILKVQ